MLRSPSLLAAPCGRCEALPTIGDGRVDEEVEPVGRLLYVRAALEPDGASVPPARERSLHDVGQAGQGRHRRLRAQVDRAIRKEIAAVRLRRDVAGPDVRPRRSRQALLVAGGRRGAMEFELGLRGQHVRDTVLVDAQPVDLLEQP